MSNSLPPKLNGRSAQLFFRLFIITIRYLIILAASIGSIVASGYLAYLLADFGKGRNISDAVPVYEYADRAMPIGLISYVLILIVLLTIVKSILCPFSKLPYWLGLIFGSIYLYLLFIFLHFVLYPD